MIRTNRLTVIGVALLAFFVSFNSGLYAQPNTYNGIPVEVTGVPYNFDDIRGNHQIDYPINNTYERIPGWQSYSFVNFRIDKFVYEFKSDGSLIFYTHYSYDRTPAGGNSFFPASSRVHTWNITPSYHSHGGRICSIYRYDDTAVAQAELNEMRKDPSLDRVYNILLSVAQDMDYDYNQIGTRVSFVTPRPLTGVCDDYADLLISRLRAANIPGVSNIVKVSSRNHAWVTLSYQGRTLYLDATWFDGNNIENGVVVNIPRKNPRNMTFNLDTFTNHGHHHLSDW